MQKLTHLSLFTGVGGLDIAATAAGFETVGQCEWADYPTGVLEKHWPDVPRWRDIRTLTKEGFYERTGLQTVTVVSGGFPCQPFSQAGKRRGAADDRYLWPEMLRVVRDLRPTWVVAENVAGLARMALDQVLTDLEGEGYTAGAIVFPAVAVGAPHRRDRVAILAYTDGVRCVHGTPAFNVPEKGHEAWLHLGTGGTGMAESGAWIYSPRGSNKAAWPAEPGVPRVVDGIPHQVDRITCLGNAVVPQQFFPIFETIAELEGLTV